MGNKYYYSDEFLELMEKEIKKEGNEIDSINAFFKKQKGNSQYLKDNMGYTGQQNVKFIRSKDTVYRWVKQSDNDFLKNFIETNRTNKETKQENKSKNKEEEKEEEEVGEVKNEIENVPKVEEEKEEKNNKNKPNSVQEKSAVKEFFNKNKSLVVFSTSAVLIGITSYFIFKNIGKKKKQTQTEENQSQLENKENKSFDDNALNDNLNMVDY